MHLQIQHKDLGISKSWKAKTSRGFNQKQLKEQEEFRQHIKIRALMLQIDKQNAADPNYQAALLEFMTTQ